MSAKPYSVFDVGIKNIYHVPAQRIEIYVIWFDVPSWLLYAPPRPAQ
jgi:hypothetical protein